MLPPHPSFRDSVLPSTANAPPDSFDPARFQKAAHLAAELAVTIKDHVAVSAWKRQCLSKLLQNPIARRMRGGVERENAAPMMLDDEEAVQHTETQRGHGEKVEAGDHLAVVLEECPPALHLGLVGLALQPLQIARHGGFGNLKSEVPQFPVDARRTPGWILRLHAQHQPLNLHADAGATKSFRPRSPSPEQAKPSTMPGNHGIWPYDDQGIRPPRPQTAKGDPKCSIPYGPKTGSA